MKAVGEVARHGRCGRVGLVGLVSGSSLAAEREPRLAVADPLGDYEGVFVGS